MNSMNCNRGAVALVTSADFLTLHIGDPFLPMMSKLQ